MKGGLRRGKFALPPPPPLTQRFDRLPTQIACFLPVFSNFCRRYKKFGQTRMFLDEESSADFDYPDKTHKTCFSKFGLRLDKP